MQKSPAQATPTVSQRCEKGPDNKGPIALPQPALSGQPSFGKALIQRPAQLVILHLRWHL
jgi:hypothetical protein